MELFLGIVILFLVFVVGFWSSSLLGLFKITMEYKSIKLLSMDGLFYKYLMSEGRVQFRNWLKRNNYLK